MGAIQGQKRDGRVVKQTKKHIEVALPLEAINKAAARSGGGQ